MPSGELRAQRLRSPLLLTFPQSGVWEMKHLLLGAGAGLIDFGEKGEGGRVTSEEHVLPVPRNQRGIVHLSGNCPASPRSQASPQTSSSP